MDKSRCGGPFFGIKGRRATWLCRSAPFAWHRNRDQRRLVPPRSFEAAGSGAIVGGRREAAGEGRQMASAIRTDRAESGASATTVGEKGGNHRCRPVPPRFPTRPERLSEALKKEEGPGNPGPNYRTSRKEARREQGQECSNFHAKSSLLSGHLVQRRAAPALASHSSPPLQARFRGASAPPPLEARLTRKKGLHAQKEGRSIFTGRGREAQTGHRTPFTLPPCSPMPRQNRSPRLRCTCIHWSGCPPARHSRDYPTPQVVSTAWRRQRDKERDARSRQGQNAGSRPPRAEGGE